MGRLSLSPDCADLDAPLAAAPDAVRVQAGWAVAQWAIQHNGLSHPALAQARLGGPSEPIAALVEELDNRYFELQELLDEEGERSKADVLAAFRRARAANSLEFAVRGEADEAVYEAAASTEDVGTLRQVVMGALGL
jgi:hypothetical protein